MAYTPISNTPPQYENNGVPASGYYIKFYAAGTTTPTAMSIDSTGNTTLDKCELNTQGYPINGSGAVFIPHINVRYKIALYRSEADANANDLSSAVWPAVDILEPVVTKSSIDILSGYEGVSLAVAAITAAPSNFPNNTAVTTLSYRTASECAALSIEYPDGGASDYVIVPSGSGTDDGGSFINAGSKQLKIRISDSVNYAQYGGNLNSSFDNSIPVNKALAFVNHVILPKGNINFINSISMDVAGSSLIGKGRGSTNLIFPDDTNGIFMNKESQQVKNLTLKNTSSTSTSGAGMSANQSAESLVDNVFIDGFYHSILIQNSQAFKFTNSSMWYFMNSGILLAGNLNNDYFFDSVFINGGARAGGVGPATKGINLIDKCDAIMFSRMEVILCDYALHTNITTGLHPAFCRFSDSFFDSATNGALLNKSKDFTFTGCWFSNRPNSGVSIVNSESTLFEATTFANCGGNGATLDALSDNTRFSSCKFISNGTVGTSGQDIGLKIANNAKRFTVLGCEFLNGAGFPTTQDKGLQIGSGSDNYIVSSNVFIANKTAAVDDSSTPSQGFWSDNIGYRLANFGVTGVTLSSGLATIPHGLSKTPEMVSVFLKSGGGAEAQYQAADATNITVRVRNTTNNGNASGSYFVSWEAKA